MEKYVLVTGGAGFIGSHTCQALLLKGFPVLALDSFSDYYDPALKRENVRLISETAEMSGAPFLFVERDIRDAARIDKVFSGCSIESVIHLAACAGVRPSIENPILYYDTNIMGTLNLLEAMRRHGTASLIFSSSSSVYGNSKKTPFSEDDFVDTPISPYAASKKAGELICHTYSHLHGISVACLRFFTVYGERQRPDLAIHKFAKLMKAGLPIPVYGDGTSRRNYTYISDIVAGIMGSLDWVSSGDPKYEVFNLGGSQTIPLSDMIKSLERAMGLTASIERLPEQPGDMEKTEADISRAFRAFGYNPSVMFDEGISRFIKWLN